MREQLIRFVDNKFDNAYRERVKWRRARGVMAIENDARKK